MAKILEESKEAVQMSDGEWKPFNETVGERLEYKGFTFYLYSYCAAVYNSISYSVKLIYFEPNIQTDEERIKIVHDFIDNLNQDARV